MQPCTPCTTDFCTVALFCTWLHTANWTSLHPELVLQHSTASYLYCIQCISYPSWPSWPPTLHIAHCALHIVHCMSLHITHSTLQISKHWNLLSFQNQKSCESFGHSSETHFAWFTFVHLQFQGASDIDLRPYMTLHTRNALIFQKCITAFFKYSFWEDSAAVLHQLEPGQNKRKKSHDDKGDGQILLCIFCP